METKHNVPINSAEIAGLWTSYVIDSASVCILKHFLANLEDKEIEAVIEYGLQLAEGHLIKLESFFNKEQMVVPVGFTENDLNGNAPRLFTDSYYLFYMQNMGKFGVESYAMQLSNSARLDIAEYFTECLNELSQLFNKATEVMLSKGISIRAPFIPQPKKVEFVKQAGYLTGWLGHKRPLNVIELSSTYFNLINNQIGQATNMGFSQVAVSKEVRDYLLRGRNIANKHIEIFGSLLSEDQLLSANAWNAQPTDSKVAPFSDKLMMYHTMVLNSSGIGHYGVSLGKSQRRDLGAIYTRLIAEVVEYASDGANIMIKNGWMEQPPQAADRDELSK